MLNQEEVTSESQAEEVPKHKGAQAPNPQEEATSESEEAPVQHRTRTPNLQEEATSDSQPEIVQVPKAKANPKLKQPKRKQKKRRQGIQALGPITRHAEDTSSSGSFESKRLRAARAKWNAPAAEVTSESDDADSGAMQSIQFEAGCSTRPVTSCVFLRFLRLYRPGHTG